MEKKDLPISPIAPELKHDTMEYAASTAGDDQMDPINEDEEITADELDALEEDGPEGEAYALNAVETDSIADEDNFLTTPDDVDELEEDVEDESDNEIRR